MDAEQIVKLTAVVIRDLLAARHINALPKAPPVEQRRSERWPFPGAVEVWLPEQCYGERHMLATLHNLSLDGFAMRARRAIPTGTKISIALHQPELSCYGDALVRHCSQAPFGYLIGCEFVFPSEDEGQ